MIPNRFHFIYGLAPDFGGKPFGLVHYLAIKSAIEINQPDEVLFFYQYEPDSEWFRLIKPNLTMVKVIAPDSVFGNPLCHVAHKADLIRLVALYQFGGIYLDLDTICTKPFSPLLNEKMVMGLQLYKEGEYGLCNAVMLAEQKSPFIGKWLDTYQLFRSPGRSEFWDEHSVRIPRLLADFLPEDIRVEPYDSFHYPSISPGCLKKMFVENHTFDNAYCHHLWESLSWKYIGNLTEEQIMSTDTSYNRIARRFLTQNNTFNLTKSDPEILSNELAMAMEKYRLFTPLSFLNQQYYSEERKNIREYMSIRPFLRRIPFLYKILSFIRNQFTSK